jgi:hypothetical protein
MTAYLTPERFRTMGHGANVSGMSDLTIAEYLEDARAVSDAYCSVPYSHSFLGGVIVGEQRPWRFPSTTAYNDVGSRRIFPKHWPITTVQEMRIVVAASSWANMPVDTLVIDQSRRFVEVTAATLVNTSGLFGVAGWIVPFGGMQQPIAEIDYTYGAFLEADDRLYPVGDSDVIYQAPHGYWHDDVVGEAEAEVSVAGTPVTTGFTIDRDEGRVVFDVAPPGAVTAHYWHKLYPEISRANAIIAADLIGHSKLVSKGMSGLQSITVGEIKIQKETVRQALGAGLDTTLPRAAELLQGFKYWSAA